MKTYWTLANLFSLGNAACGLISLFFSFSRDFILAALLLLAAVAFDFLDGKTARFFKQDSLFGKGLDSLSDITSFGIAPAFLGYALSPHRSILELSLLLLFVLAGIWRLAYFFQWKKPERPPGMPITLNGIIFPALFFFHSGEKIFLIFFILSFCAMVIPIFLKNEPVS
ncbi:MAG: CDP-alcohol phosphatidyltransferase family protein [Firmicutes bacterium]|nr:CDP-alcohol phosphatidyltransferase family protein [Bacillota bacterium]